jgi:alpha-galactosidase
MRYEDNKVKGLNIAYIGGGSRGWARNLMRDLATEEQLSGTVKLYDIDYKAACDNATIGNSLAEYPENRSKWKYEAYKTIGRALTGADLVVISIIPGTFDEMESDVHLPEEYGIYQPVGDSTGPGGIVRALRTIPMFVEFAEAIKRYCPKAWVINYTNPMTLCVRTLYKVFPEIKAFGCCHEVFKTQEQLGIAYTEKTGIKLTRHDVNINVLGINHFTWVNKASYQNIDLMPYYAEFVDKYYETGYGDWTSTFWHTGHRVKFDLFKRYGIIGAAGDRHLAEFCPPWYLKDPETVAKWKFHLTPVNHRKKDLKNRLKTSARLLAGKEKMELKASGEESIKQIKAILGLGNFVTNVNMPNMGQLIGLPLDAVVETNAVFSRDSVIPVISGEFPPEVNNLVLRNIINQETTLIAALTKDVDQAFRAFVNDPLVVIEIDKARELFKRMLDNTKKYLPGWQLQ